jgi:histidyl-tRNA synthetase
LHIVFIATHRPIGYNAQRIRRQPLVDEDVVSGTIEAVRGMHDGLPDEQRAVAQTRAKIEQLLAGYGYDPIDLPAIEPRELYLRKLGEELVGKVYEFTFGGRELALRPEWTASVLRAYVAHLQDQPLPLRLSYCGPVFRYERPQRLTYRQFTQLGGELIGAPAPRPDAEMIALACQGLEAVGITTYRVMIGHVGLARTLLGGLGLPERTQGALMWNMERLRTQGVSAVREYLAADQGAPPAGLELPPGLDNEQAAAWLLRVLEAMQIDLSTGTRTPEAVVQRLLRRLGRSVEAPQIDRALALLEQLGQIRGAPEPALAQLDALFSAAGYTASPGDELRAVLELLAAHGVSTERITLDCGLGRGLQYYTGLIFEIYDSDDMQLCGGGRYDDLVQALGGRHAVPAVGFAYGLERVAAVAQFAAPAAPRTALVAPVEAADYPYALKVAHRLRACGYVVTVDVRGRNVATNLRDAARRNVGYVAIVGAAEREQNAFVWRDLAAHREERVGLESCERLILDG